MYFEQKHRIAVWGVSALVGVLVATIPLTLGLYAPQQPYLVPLNQKANNAIALGLVTALAFPAVVEISNYRRSRQVDRNVPRLLRDIAEAVRSGVALPKALEEASQRDYGPISPELKRSISMFVLGESWQDCLRSLAERLRRPSVLRLSTVLTEAHQMGGRIVEVLETSISLFQSLDEYREERRNNMRPYIVTMYVAAFIFLVIARVVLSQFLAPLCQVSDAAGEYDLLTGVLEIKFYTSVLFWASIIESFFSGLIAGKIGEGSLSAGLYHSVILIVLTLIFFNVSL